MAERLVAGVEAEGPPPGPWQIFLAFSKVGLTSFGGGLSGWMLREFVLLRRWLSEEEFLSGLALSQALPGVNVVNMSIWIGYRLRGGAGALAGALGMVVPAMLVAIAIVVLAQKALQGQVAHLMLAGVAAAAMGLSLQMGLRAAWHATTGIVPVLIMAVTFGAIVALRLPLLPVVAVMAPLAIAHAAWRLRRPPAPREGGA